MCVPHYGDFTICRIITHICNVGARKWYYVCAIELLIIGTCVFMLLFRS